MIDQQPEWLAAVSIRALPSADWWQSACGGSVDWQTARRGEGVCCQDGWLGAFELCLQECFRSWWAGWRPACVVWCPWADKGQQLLVTVPAPEHSIKEVASAIDPDSSKLQPHLLGAWREVWVDPNTSRACLATCCLLPVSPFEVKAATRRVQLADEAAGR